MAKTISSKQDVREVTAGLSGSAESRYGLLMLQSSL